MSDDPYATLRRMTLAAVKRHSPEPTNRAGRRAIEQEAARRTRRAIRKARRMAKVMGA